MQEEWFSKGFTFDYILQLAIKQMSANTFDMYEKLRAYQLHCNRMENQNLQVPNHISYSPTLPNLDNAKVYHKNKKNFEIQAENGIIMKKLVSINSRKPELQSTPNLTLPPIKNKKFQVPLYEDANSKIAKRIIKSKASIDLRKLQKNYHSHAKFKNNISKYDTNANVPINRKKYVAQLLLLKKLKMSRVLNPEI